MYDLNSANSFIQLKGKSSEKLKSLIQVNKSILRKINQKVLDDIEQFESKTFIFANDINADVPFSAIAELLRFMIVKNCNNIDVRQNIEHLIYDDYLHEQDALVINTNELLSKLSNDSKALNNPHLKKAIVTLRSAVEAFIKKENNISTLNQVAEKIKKGINTTQTCVTIFQSELALSNKSFDRLVNFMNLSLNILLQNNEELFTIWSDGEKKAVNVQAIKLTRELATAAINIKEQSNTSLDDEKEQSNNVLTFHDTGTSYKHMQDIDEKETACDLCKTIKTVDELPNTKQGWDIVTQNGYKHLRMWYLQNGKRCIVYSNIINYCPCCGKKL